MAFCGLNECYQRDLQTLFLKNFVLLNKLLLKENLLFSMTEKYEALQESQYSASAALAVPVSVSVWNALCSADLNHVLFGILTVKTTSGNLRA